MKFLKSNLLLLILFIAVIAESEKQRIAIVGLDKKGVTELEGAAAELSVRNAFVNSAKYKVLDRENMDKVLIERTIASDGLYDKDRATDIGKVLNVHFIMVGTLMKFEGDFLMELRVIDVENSSVAGSSTGKCSSSGELLQLAEYLVNKVCSIDKQDVMRAIEDSNQIQAKVVLTDKVREVETLKTATNSEDYEPVVAIDSNPEIFTEEIDSVVDTLKLTFREVGLSLADYDHYKSSKLQVSDWIKMRRKKSTTAALIGFCSGTSGFFYTGDYGTGMLITLSKALGVIGLISNRKKGGAKYWAFAGLTTVATAVDAVGVSVAVEKRNKKLNVLLEKLPELDYESETGLLSINLNRKF